MHGPSPDVLLAPARYFTRKRARAGGGAGPANHSAPRSPLPARPTPPVLPPASPALPPLSVLLFPSLPLRLPCPLGLTRTVSLPLCLARSSFSYPVCSLTFPLLSVGLTGLGSFSIAGTLVYSAKHVSRSFPRSALFVNFLPRFSVFPRRISRFSRPGRNEANERSLGHSRAFVLDDELQAQAGRILLRSKVMTSGTFVSGSGPTSSRVSPRRPSAGTALSMRNRNHAVSPLLFVR
jgi:hypothetical protein